MKKIVLVIIIILVVSFIVPGIVTFIHMKISGTGSIHQETIKPQISGVVVTYEDGRIKMPIDGFLVYVLGEIYEDGDTDEYLKARCVMARTLVYKCTTEDGNIYSDNINVSYLTQKQFSEKYKDKTSEQLEYFEGIVKSTCDDKIYYDDKLIEPLYHTLSAGITKDGSSICKCLKSISCPEDVECPEYEVTSVFDNEEITKALGGDNITILSRDKAGYVDMVKVGDKVMTGETICTLLGLQSSCMYFKPLNDTVEITTRGIGNGYGLSIYCAKCMAASGSSYQDILARFYKKIDIRK